MRQPLRFLLLFVTQWVTQGCLLAAGLAVITDHTSYNAGSEVRLRLQPSTSATVSIRYSGETEPVATGIRVSGSDYAHLWTIPWNTKTGRYQVDITTTGGKQMQNAASFAVHRQLTKIMSVELDKTFYTSGDSVNPRITVRNVCNRRLDNLRIEFEPYTYPWIAPAADEPPIWKHIVSDSLSLSPGEEKTFDAKKAAVVRADKEPVVIYYSVVVRDSRDPERIFDLAFAPPAFTRPINSSLTKQYPFLYLYSHLADLPKSEAYRQFYPSRLISDAISFERGHTMFSGDAPPTVSYSVKQAKDSGWRGAVLRARVLDARGKELQNERNSRALEGRHEWKLRPLSAGLYRVEVSVESEGATVARSEIEVAVNALPKSILVFCAHQDDDTAHPGIIRAAVENHIPIHFAYFTSGDAGGCDRFYMHSCDAARALDFGEVRMEEARASLDHLGVPKENIWFLGLPDGGLEQIWNRHKRADDPYLSVLLASDHSPYSEAAIPNLPYSRDSAVAAAKQFIAKFKPDMIITGHPDERHVDHRTNNWIVVKAMQELLRESVISRDTKLVVDRAYGAVPGKNAPYRYKKETLYVSGEAARLGQEATWYYQSQDGNHYQANIVDFGKLPREEPYPHFRILDWQDHEGWNERQ
jgi:LmbE family N-acetylglucosaminyl deacetylase